MKPAEIAELVGKTVQEQLAPVQGLLKQLEAPASKAGMSPQAMIAHMTAGGNLPGTFDPTGRFTPAKAGRCLFPEGTEQSKAWRESLVNLMVSSGHGGASYQDRLKATDYLSTKGWKSYTAPERKTALAESSGILGGYTVPQPFAEALLTKAVEDSIMEMFATKLPMTALTLDVPYLDITTTQAAGVSPFLGGLNGAWVAESQTRTETEPQFRQLNLKAYEYSFYSVASNTLLADNVVALDSVLTGLFASAISWFTDYAYFRGSGVGSPLGVLNAAAAISVSRQQANSFTFYDAAKMLSKLWGPSGWQKGNAFWAISQSVLPQLVTMGNGENYGNSLYLGRPVWTELDQGARGPLPDGGRQGMTVGTLFGKPVCVTEKLPPLGTQGDVMLIEGDSYVLGKRQDLQIAVSEHVNFLKNQTTWRTTWRGDGQPWLSGAITLANGTDKVSGYVYLT